MFVPFYMQEYFNKAQIVDKRRTSTANWLPKKKKS